MPASLFLSHVYEDLSARDQVRDWAARGLLGRDVVVTGESDDVRAKGSAAIRGQLSPKLQGAAAILVLVGNDTHNRPWIDYEVQHALSNRKQVIVVRIPNTKGAAPSALAGRTIVPMDPSAIRAALGA